jgi:lipoyl(octanoyl) transferase
LAPLPDNNLLTLDQTAHPMPAAWQMACDEVLLRNSTTALLRVYSWQHPTWTFGYFQKLQAVIEAQAMSPGSPTRLMRRWTGGGMVDHTHDLPYSLILPNQHPWARLSTAESYLKIHTALLTSLRAHNIKASLQIAPPLNGTQCFESPVTADLMLAGKKIAGAAQRRSRYGLLHQGSLQLPIDLLNSSSMLHEFGRALTPNLETTSISQKMTTEICNLAFSKYATIPWLELR